MIYFLIFLKDKSAFLLTTKKTQKDIQMYYFLLFVHSFCFSYLNKNYDDNITRMDVIFMSKKTTLPGMYEFKLNSILHPLNQHTCMYLL